MAYLNDLLNSHQELLTQFREQVDDVLPKFPRDFQRSDHYLFRYLVARDFNLDKAEELLRKNVEWRKSEAIDQVLHVTIPPQIIKICPLGVTGTDRRGCPVVYHAVGKWNAATLIRNGWQETAKILFRQYFERCMEINEKLTKETGQPTCQYFAIYDMKGFDYSQLLKMGFSKFTQDMMVDYMENFPEVGSYFHIINAPKLFQLLFAIIKPFLTGRMLQKIIIHDNNEQEWKSKLLEEAGAGNLPSCCGGSITTWFKDYSETGVSSLDLPQIESLPNGEFQKIFIPAGQKHRVDLRADTGSSLVWNFKTEDSVIGFEVLYRGKEYIVEYCKVDSHRFMQKGLIQCKNSGSYSLIFNNCNSTGQTLYVATQMRDEASKK